MAEGSRAPSKAQFRMTLFVVLLSKPAWGLVKLWAARTKTEPGDGIANRTADAVLVIGG